MLTDRLLARPAAIADGSLWREPGSSPAASGDAVNGRDRGTADRQPEDPEPQAGVPRLYHHRHASSIRWRGPRLVPRTGAQRRPEAAGANWPAAPPG